MDILGSLPVEIGQQILSLLGPDDLARASRVSKSWRHLTDSDLLWKDHCRDAELSLNGQAEYAESYREFRAILSRWKQKEGEHYTLDGVFVSDGITLAGKVEDSELQIWNLESGQPVLTQTLRHKYLRHFLVASTNTQYILATHLGGFLVLRNENENFVAHRLYLVGEPHDGGVEVFPGDLVDSFLAEAVSRARIGPHVRALSLQNHYLFLRVVSWEDGQCCLVRVCLNSDQAVFSPPFPLPRGDIQAVFLEDSVVVFTPSTVLTFELSSLELIRSFPTGHPGEVMVGADWRGGLAATLWLGTDGLEQRLAVHNKTGILEREWILSETHMALGPHKSIFLLSHIHRGARPHERISGMNWNLQVKRVRVQNNHDLWTAVFSIPYPDILQLATVKSALLLVHHVAPTQSGLLAFDVSNGDLVHKLETPWFTCLSHSSLNCLVFTVKPSSSTLVVSFRKSIKTNSSLRVLENH